MNVLFVSSVSVITAAPAEDQALFTGALGLPLAGQDDYVFTEGLSGVKHFGVWPLTQAAQACFGVDQWPADHPVPQASIEFDVDDVATAANELQDQGHRLLHPPRTEPWGQTVARLQSPGGLIVGVSHTPWMRETTDTSSS
ncbi:MAG: VOC family protein [Mycobacteriales bacterium]